MSKAKAKRLNKKKQVGEVSAKKKSDMIFIIAAVAAVVLSLIFVPKALALIGVSFLAAGSGLSKLFSIVVAAGLGWLCLMPSQSYKDFIALSKGARTEWRKTVKPDKDTVMKTTMMVLAIVALFALIILILDWVFGSILRSFIN